MQQFNPRDYVVSKRNSQRRVVEERNYKKKVVRRRHYKGEVVWYSQIQCLMRSGETQKVIDIIDRLHEYDQQNYTTFLRKAFLEEGVQGWTLLHLAAEKDDVVVASKIIDLARTLNILEEVLYCQNSPRRSPHQVACDVACAKSGVAVLLHEAMIADLNLDFRSQEAGCSRAESCWEDPKSLGLSSDADIDEGDGAGEWDDVLKYSRWYQVKDLIAIMIDPEDREDAEWAKRQLLDDYYLPIIFTEKIYDNGLYSGLQWFTKRCLSDLVITLMDKATTYDRQHSTTLVKQALLFKGIQGFTLLHFAAGKGFLVLVKKIVAVAHELGIRDAVLGAKLENGRTPLEVAQCFRHASVVDFIVKL